MKLFKKALVATAVIGAFSAQAVTVSSSKVQISKEGTEHGLKAVVAETATDAFVLDFVVDKLTPAASTITLTFDSSVSLTNIISTDSSVNNVIGTGTGKANVGSTANAIFGYGTGSFTFDKFNIGETDDGEDTISFDVNLGNPLTASSAFRLTLDTFGAGNGVAISGEAQVCYESRDAADVLIEQGCSTISEVKSQFSFEVLDANEWDGRIERVEQQTFSRNADVSSDTADTLKFKVSNDETLAAALTVATANLGFAGDFTAVTVDELTTANSGIIAMTPTFVTDEDEINFVLTTVTQLANTGVAQTGVVTFDSNGSGSLITIPQTGAIEATITFIDTTSIGSSQTGTTVELSDSAGSWSLDATVINVPYLPLGFDDTSASVHIANDGSTSANVMATIVTYCDSFADDSTCTDQTRSMSVDLGDVPANTVAKLKQGALMTAFGLTDATKVSVTFNIDAYAEDISAYATVQNATGRTEVSNSQAKVDGK